MTTENIDIINMIELAPINKITESSQIRLLDKIKSKFNPEEQKIFIANFMLYLNYDPFKDFLINLDDIWKWCGFSRKDHAKTLLNKHFINEVDFQVKKLATANGGASFQNVNEGSKLAPEVAGASFEPEISPKHGGQNKETIMLSVNTFKKFCLKANTKKADQIHDYYIKLEELLQETIIEDSKTLEHQYKLSQNTIEQLNKKLEKKQRTKYELSNCVYIISNKFFTGYYKIGKSSSFNSRLNSYVAGSPVDYTVEYLFKVRNKCEETIIENMVLQILGKYRVKNHMDQEREWLHGIDLNTIKNEIYKCSEFLNERRDLYENNEIENNEIENIEIENNEIEKQNLQQLKNKIKIIYESDVNDVSDEEEEKEEIEVDENNLINSKKYDIDISKVEIKRNNPVDFKKFISDCCEIGVENFVIQTELKCAFKIWGKTYIKDVEKQFTEYMKENFKNTNIFIDNQKRHVYKGLKLKELTYQKTNKNFDFEEFIETKCKIDYLYRISYHDFFHFFTIWKKEKGEEDFKLNKSDRMKIQEILELTFAKGRVLHSTSSKTKNLYGIFGIGLEENNFGLIEKKRQNKKVGEYDVDTDELIKEYDSINLCAHNLNIPTSTFSSYIRNKTVLNGKYYKLIE